MSFSPKKYDVFISFRGEDTRSTITAQLHRALCKEQIETFIDYNLKKGDEVAPALVQAIQNSRISVVVFSENYATSKWCLNELLDILKYRKHHGQVVIPVFYKIDPSHVRHQKGSYEKAFAKYKGEVTENGVSAWEAALTQAANICGWDCASYRDDSEVTENIVKDVRQKLSLMYPKKPEDLVEIDENSKHSDLLLKKYTRIGIWGMGGIGKTTIARQMFAKHMAQYDSVCFMEIVKEEERFGLTWVRNKLLSELLKQQITTSDVVGSTFIKRKLKARKIFIVLDNVDNVKHLEYLCEELGDLGSNSKLIITTRYRHILHGKVDEIYKVEKWKTPESLSLFSLRAFNQIHPKEGFESVSERVVAYAGGIPLALIVLGSHFHSREHVFWEHELSHLENQGEPLYEIQELLKVSYDGLTVGEKEMFLDIAFFFHDENKDFVTRILDACGFNTNGIKTLEDKALLTISKSNRIQMHDLLRKMALDIVRYKNYSSRRKLRKRSRLRDIEEVRDVLKYKGSDAIEGIIFDLSQRVDLRVRVGIFKKMINLRFLRLYVPSGKKRLAAVYHSEVIMAFPDKLRYVEWNGYPFKSLPQPFCAELLVEIRLPHSNVEHLWHDVQELVNLEGIDLSECKQLINLPDLSWAPKLKWLYLSGCESLCEVQPCVFSKNTLVTLLLDRCKKLKSLMSEKHLTSLENINVNGCLRLTNFALSSDSIKSLDLRNTGVQILHSSIGGMKKLMWLNLEGLRLTTLPNTLSSLKSLAELWLSNCKIVTKSKLEDIFAYDGLQSLEILHLNDCCNLFELPRNISSLPSLYKLRLDGSSVETLPTSIKYLLRLEILSLNYCKKLRSLPELPPCIQEFHAENCASLAIVSTLKSTFPERINGKEIYISFKNSMKLDALSLHHVPVDAILTMKSAAFHNILVRKHRLQTCSYNYNSSGVCLPGSRVPGQFKYLTTDSSITIGRGELSYSLGFIFFVVVSPINGINDAKIQCQCYSENGRKVGYASRWHHKTIMNLNSDHVFVWYDPYHSDSILRNDETKLSFEFCVTTNTWGELDGFVRMKECGICPIYFSEFPMLVDTLNLDMDSKTELCEAVQLELNSIGRYDEGEDNGNESAEICDDKEGNSNESAETFDDKEDNNILTKIQSQKPGLHEKQNGSFECLMGPLRYLWRLLCT